MHRFFAIFINTAILAGPLATAPSADKDFIDTSHRISVAIVRDDQLAASQSASPTIHALADSLTRYHQLQRMTGTQFDIAYTYVESVNQEALVELFQQEAGAGRDSLAREFAKNTLPDL